jgi:transcriptional repressor NrdR
VICPYCNANDDKVIDSRATDGGAVIRRRRQCLECSKRFTTYERVEELARLFVVKRDGSRAAWDRAKVANGVQIAFGKRPVPQAVRERIVDEIEEQVYRDYEKEVPSKAVGLLVCARLREVDEVAYIRFASEYYRFKDLGELVSELQQLNGRIKDAKEQQHLF